MKKEATLTPDSLWYKDAVIYELHVKSFCDSNDDGIGDFRGLIGKLPYLQSLGVTAIWLLPFYPSPQRDDGYDISDYCSINPDYGDMEDFREFLHEAHRLGMRVITELVVNHTSDQHPWFQRARSAPPGSPARNYYVWSNTPEKYKDARIIFKDFEVSNWSLDPVAGAYFWHRFYHHQPDLNYENPQVQKEIFRVVDFWLSLGVDGLRLDAVPYLYEAEGTSCENLPQTHEFLKKLRGHINSKFKDKMLLCEANQWPEDAAAYFGAGDECNMAFHFPVMPRLFMSLWMEDAFPVTDILSQTPPIPDSCQWAVFLRNHDELTLEMVTDEERDYMYKIYARDSKARINLGIRRRLSPLLGNNRRKVELMNILLFSLPGTPVLYYGDEIGMGDNFHLGDRNGVRTPMQWSPDRNAGFSRTNPQKLFLPVVVDPEYHYESVNVESQEGNLSSLLWWMKRVIAMRENFKAFGRGTLEPIQSDNPKIIAFVRRYGDELILVAANLSRFSQAASLDLAKYSGYVPVEVFSGSNFPPIGSSPYLLTPGFHGYYWFQLKKQGQGHLPPDDRPMPEFNLAPLSWDDISESALVERLEPAIVTYLKKNIVGQSAPGSLRRIKALEIFPFPSGAKLVFLEAYHTQGWTETYILPLAFLSGDRAEDAANKYPQALIASLTLAEGPGKLFDSVWLPSFHVDMLARFLSRRKLLSGEGQLYAQTSPAFRHSMTPSQGLSESKVLKAGDKSVSIVYGSQYLLRFYRRLEEGASPELEIGTRLADRAASGHLPAVYGGLSLSRKGRFYGTVAALRAFVPNQGTAWTRMTDEVSKYYDAVLASTPALPPPVLPELRAVNPKEVQPDIANLMGAFSLEMAALLGKQTGEMHLAILSGEEDPAFSSEPFTRLHQRSVYQAISGHCRKSLQYLAKKADDLPLGAQEDVRFILGNQQKLLKLLQQLTEKKFSGRKIRIHGNCSLEQALFTGKEFVIKDFDGDIGNSVGERRIKRSPLRDVSEMLLSFFYAAHAPFLMQGRTPKKDMATLSGWTDLWFSYAAGAFLKGYLDSMRGTTLVPQPAEEFYQLLRIYLADRAVLKLSAEAAARPDWALVPAKFLRQTLLSPTDAKPPGAKA